MQYSEIKMLINRKVVTTTIIVLIMIFSTFRVLDSYVDNYTDESIKNAAIAYATARGVNAIVSVLQTSTIEAGMIVSGSVSPGELLDPLNDLIERFSTVMTFALGSLVAQKILLLISAHNVFINVILLLGAASIMALFFGSNRHAGVLIKFFLITVFIRFSLGLVIVFNSAVDHVFLIDDTRKYEHEIEKFSDELNLDDLTDKMDDKSYFETIEKKVEDSVLNFMNLMMVFILKSIVFPLFFFYLFMKIIKGIWGMQSHIFIEPSLQNIEAIASK